MFKKALTLVVMCVAMITLTGCIDKGNGKKVGMLTKASQEGILCKTYEATIQRGGFNGGSGVNGQAFNFTIENSPELVKKVEELMNRQAEVEITYRSEVATFCRAESDNHFLVDIKELHNDAPVTVVAAENKPANVEQNTNGSGSNDKILQLLQVQTQLLNEIVKERQSR